ncbi:MAG: chemotaxis protein CheW [Gammaproteobacteria bacterium]|nr:chemotaxis protein CheW [Gammaproteobacteria bacterium]
MHISNSQVDEREDAATQYLSFSLGDEDFGVDILKVQEIRGWQSVREVPEAPSFMRGVINLRGLIVPIIDLRNRLGKGETHCTPTTVIIVLKVVSAEAEHTVGLVVDGVANVLDIGANEIRPVSSSNIQMSASYVMGIVSISDDMVMLLDIDALFKNNDLNIYENDI